MQPEVTSRLQITESIGAVESGVSATRKHNGEQPQTDGRTDITIMENLLRANG